MANDNGSILVVNAPRFLTEARKDLSCSAFFYAFRTAPASTASTGF